MIKRGRKSSGKEFKYKLIHFYKEQADYIEKVALNQLISESEFVRRACDEYKDKYFKKVLKKL